MTSTSFNITSSFVKLLPWFVALVGCPKGYSKDTSSKTPLDSVAVDSLDSRTDTDSDTKTHTGESSETGHSGETGTSKPVVIDARSSPATTYHIYGSYTHNLRGVGDINSDGRDDLEVNPCPMNDYDCAALFFAGDEPERTIEKADLIFLSEEKEPYYPEFGAAGDNDGDGGDDLLLLIKGASTFLYILNGPLTSIDLDGAQGSISSSSTGNVHYIPGRRDIDGDSQDDVAYGLATYYYEDQCSGAVSLHRGPLYGNVTIDDASAFIIGESDGLDRDGTGHYSALIDDANGNGTPELVINAYGSNALYIFDGSATGNLSVGDADSILRPSSEGTGNRSWNDMTLGDSNNDGYGDFTVSGSIGISFEDTIFVLTGPFFGETPLEDSVSAVIQISEVKKDEYFMVYCMSQSTGPGDLNGDGFDDLLVGVPCNRKDPGWCESAHTYVFYGPLTGTLGAEDADIDYIGETVLFGELVGSPGDTNADGFPDMLIQDYDNAYLLLGGPL